MFHTSSGVPSWSLPEEPSPRVNWRPVGRLVPLWRRKKFDCTGCCLAFCILDSALCLKRHQVVLKQSLPFCYEAFQQTEVESRVDPQVDPFSWVQPRASLRGFGWQRPESQKLTRVASFWPNPLFLLKAQLLASPPAVLSAGLSWEAARGGWREQLASCTHVAPWALGELGWVRRCHVPVPCCPLWLEWLYRPGTPEDLSCQLAGTVSLEPAFPALPFILGSLLHWQP